MSRTKRFFMLNVCHGAWFVILLCCSGMALSHFANGSTETVDLRNLGNTTDPRHSASTSEGSRATSESTSRYPSITSEQSTTSVTSSTNNSPVRTMSGLGSPKASRRAQPAAVTGIHVTIPNKVRVVRSVM